MKRDSVYLYVHQHSCVSMSFLQTVLVLELVPGFVQCTEDCAGYHTLLGRGTGRDLGSQYIA